MGIILASMELQQSNTKQVIEDTDNDFPVGRVSPSSGSTVELQGQALNHCIMAVEKLSTPHPCNRCNLTALVNPYICGASHNVSHLTRITKQISKKTNCLWKRVSSFKTSLNVLSNMDSGGDTFMLLFLQANNSISILPILVPQDLRGFSGLYTSVCPDENLLGVSEELESFFDQIREFHFRSLILIKMANTEISTLYLPHYLFFFNHIANSSEIIDSDTFRQLCLI